MNIIIMINKILISAQNKILFHLHFLIKIIIIIIIVLINKILLVLLRIKIDFSLKINKFKMMMK